MNNVIQQNNSKHGGSHLLSSRLHSLYYRDHAVIHLHVTPVLKVEHAFCHSPLEKKTCIPWFWCTFTQTYTIKNEGLNCPIGNITSYCSSLFKSETIIITNLMTRRKDVLPLTDCSINVVSNKVLNHFDFCRQILASQLFINYLGTTLVNYVHLH
jgi:hypothetical protein